ncbi:hypothetical protein NM688_g3639 [Phlebia brevispora]|uniref:Uncharacterized protein n=1 Tax=Phlebia brevispora TaxID=194682 RepID=A0ACC1T5E7_9APHY|nr:hypothetical protein NM688_g3639 [Phlebia brevispora]
MFSDDGDFVPVVDELEMQGQQHQAAPPQPKQPEHPEEPKESAQSEKAVVDAKKSRKLYRKLAAEQYLTFSQLRTLVGWSVTPDHQQRPLRVRRFVKFNKEYVACPQCEHERRKGCYLLPRWEKLAQHLLAVHGFTERTKSCAWPRCNRSSHADVHATLRHIIEDHFQVRCPLAPIMDDAVDKTLKDIRAHRQKRRKSMSRRVSTADPFDQILFN